MAPPPEMLRKLSPEKIYQAITTGTMAVHVAGMTDQQNRLREFGRRDRFHVLHDQHDVAAAVALGDRYRAVGYQGQGAGRAGALALRRADAHEAAGLLVTLRHVARP